MSLLTIKNIPISKSLLHQQEYNNLIFVKIKTKKAYTQYNIIQKNIITLQNKHEKVIYNI